MSQVKPASQFNFVDFKVPIFSYMESPIENGTLKIDIKPYAYYVSDLHEFRLIINFRAFEEERKDDNLISLTSISVYKFTDETGFNDIPEYFFQSALAVTYPFIRSFVATFTSQANVKRIVLGLVNLTLYNEELKEGTQVLTEKELEALVSSLEENGKG